MDVQSRDNLKQSIDDSAKKYQLDDITYGSFIAQFGYKTKVLYMYVCTYSCRNYTTGSAFLMISLNLPCLRLTLSAYMYFETTHCMCTCMTQCENISADKSVPFSDMNYPQCSAVFCPLWLYHGLSINQQHCKHNGEFCSQLCLTLSQCLKQLLTEAATPFRSQPLLLF